jgi:hypothetical protein
MAEARRALLSSSRLGGGRVHFDFLATLVNYLGPSYKFIGACVCEPPSPLVPSASALAGVRDAAKCRAQFLPTFTTCREP